MANKVGPFTPCCIICVILITLYDYVCLPSSLLFKTTAQKVLHWSSPILQGLRQHLITTPDNHSLLDVVCHTNSDPTRKNIWRAFF